jgi:hypothetical protein
MRPSTPALLGLALFFSVALAAAEDDPRKVQAAPLFAEAVKLAEKNQNAESLEQFKKAYAVYPSPNTLFNIARQEQLVGETLKAIRDYRAALSNGVLVPGAADKARVYLAELERATGRVKLTGPEGTRVTVAGAEYTLPMSEPIDVMPGKLSIDVSRAGERNVVAADVAAGALVSVEVGAMKARSAVLTTPPPTEEPHGSNVTRNVVSGSLVGVGLLGIGLGVGFTLAANSASDDLEKAKVATGGEDACTGLATPDCTARSTASDDLRRNTNLARGMYIGGGALLVGGVVAFLVWPKAGVAEKSSAQPRVAPWFSADTLGLSYGRDF